MGLIRCMKDGSRWAGKDNFPSTTEWGMEVAKWLKFIEKHGQLRRFLSRLKDQPDKRDEALAEIAAAYFFQEVMEYHIIEWEPKGKNNKTGEFTIEASKNGPPIFCEVKSPSWKGEIITERGITSRLREPKYIIAEGRAIDNVDRIRGIITKNTYLKLRNDCPNLLIFVDNLFVPLSDDKDSIKRALYHQKLCPPYVDKRPQGCFMEDAFTNLSAVGTLNIEQLNTIKYYWYCYENKRAVCSLPEE